MASPKTILILGASRGIGLRLVQKSLSKYPAATIYATARAIAKAPELKELADQNQDRLVLFEADFANPSSVKKLARAIAQLTPALDQVIYNAGVLIGWGPFTEVGVDALRENMNVNVFGAYVSTIEFAPFLAKSTFKNKVIVLVSSSFGSITTTKENFEMHSQAFGTPGFNPTAAYDISKTAENRLGLELDLELRPKGVPVLLIHPGLPKTDMNMFGNITVEESATGVVNVVGQFSPEQKENFLDYQGKVVPF